jgi:hypothetical protein
MTNHISTSVAAVGQAHLESIPRSSVHASVVIHAGTITIAIGTVDVFIAKIIPFIPAFPTQSRTGFFRSGAALATYLARIEMNPLASSVLSLLSLPSHFFSLPSHLLQDFEGVLLMHRTA